MKVTKHGWTSLGLGLLVSGLIAGNDLAVRTARGQVDVSVDLNIQSPTDFYNPLTPYGSWVSVPRYGRCWRPAEIAQDWRPYTQGHWEWTDAGWYWVSDEPFGWACYHYGQWIFDPNYGWVWLPGTEWAPAWVVWREAPDYIGWAPCGPGGVVVAQTPFVFVDVHHFHDRLAPRHLVFNDERILRRSHSVGGFRTERRDFGGFSRRIAINQGPPVETVQRATGSRFTERPVRELVRQTRSRETVLRDSRERENDRSVVNKQPAPAPARTGREQDRTYGQTPSAQAPSTVRQQPIYKEAPAQPAPTGRQQQRIYREVPNPQPVQPVPTIPPTQPNRPVVPQVPTPEKPTVRERTLPPAASERARPEAQVPRREQQPPNIQEQVPRREEQPPQATPPQAQRPAPAQQPPRREGRDRERDGQ